jgi:hypothetical protein
MIALFAMLAHASYPVAADHHAHWAGDRLQWTSTYYFDGPGPCEVALVRPLPEKLPEAAWRSDAPCDRITVHLEQSAPMGTAALDAPLADIPGLQRITLDDAEFTPDASLGLLPGVFREAWLSEAASPMERRKLDARIGGVPWSNKRAMYVLVDDELRSQGLVGTLRPIGFVNPGVLVAAIAAFLAAMAGGIFTWRHLARKARQEAVDAYIRDEFRPRAEKDATAG